MAAEEQNLVKESNNDDTTFKQRRNKYSFMILTALVMLILAIIIIVSIILMSSSVDGQESRAKSLKSECDMKLANVSFGDWSNCENCRKTRVKKIGNCSQTEESDCPCATCWCCAGSNKKTLCKSESSEWTDKCESVSVPKNCCNDEKCGGELKTSEKFDIGSKSQLLVKLEDSKFTTIQEKVCVVSLNEVKPNYFCDKIANVKNSNSSYVALNANAPVGCQPFGANVTIKGDEIVTTLIPSSGTWIQIKDCN